METTRQRVLELIKRHPQCTVSQLAVSLEISGMAVRRHISSLQGEGMISAGMSRQPRGRPVLRYSLTVKGEAQFPHTYDRLAIQLLDEVSRASRPQQVKRLLEHIGEKNAGEIAPRLAGKTLSGRVSELAKALTEQGYMAEYRVQRGKGLRLIEHNCALSEVSRRCPVICECELEMMRKLLGARVIRTEHRLQGDPRCSYLVTPFRRHRGNHA
ncbi:MAG TPA: metalloregulator ArsR/SmtB family transcription factor [Candidatus Acidoferrales bacterium]